MRRLHWFVLSFLAFALNVLSAPEPACAQDPSPDNLLVLTNATVVDVRTGALQPEQTVILERNRIYSVGPSKSAKYPRNAATVNCRGLFLIPGLWDMHVHLVFGDWFPDAKDISLYLHTHAASNSESVPKIIRTFLCSEILPGEKDFARREEWLFCFVNH
jgi:hypothetical protein